MWGIFVHRTKGKETIDKLRTKVAARLAEVGVRTLFVPLPLSSEGYDMIDYVWDYAGEHLEDLADKNKSTLIFVLKLDADLHLVFESGDMISAQHSISKKDQKNILAVLKSELGDRLNWDGQSSKVIGVKLR